MGLGIQIICMAILPAIAGGFVFFALELPEGQFFKTATAKVAAWAVPAIAALATVWAAMDIAAQFGWSGWAEKAYQISMTVYAGVGAAMAQRLHNARAAEAKAA